MPSPIIRKPSPLPRIIRLSLLVVIFLALLGFMIEKNAVPTLWRSPWGRNILRKSPSNITSEELLTHLNSQRHQAQLSAFENNHALQQAARLLTLELEDRKALAIPSDVSTYIKAVSATLPPEVETFSVFFTGLAETGNLEPLTNSTALRDESFTQIGIATRSAEIDGQLGILAVIIVSPDFESASQPQSAEAPAPALTTPTFTGQDLWQAVQNYRQAHSLPLFEQANELCTVASIRLNELLELGKLDNHDGFGPRADEFFERNPGWSAINENLASGYSNAVQTVEWGWDQSLGHQALIQSREFPKACTAANRGFAVLITGK